MNESAPGSIEVSWGTSGIQFLFLALLVSIIESKANASWNFVLVLDCPGMPAPGMQVYLCPCVTCVAAWRKYIALNHLRPLRYLRCRQCMRQTHTANRCRPLFNFWDIHQSLSRHFIFKKGGFLPVAGKLDLRYHKIEYEIPQENKVRDDKSRWHTRMFQSIASPQISKSSPKWFVVVGGVVCGFANIVFGCVLVVPLEI